MDTEQPLLAALHKCPGDDPTWLVLADWLEEHGRDRQAELLRCQRSLRGLPEGPERASLEGRVCTLLLEGVVPCVPVLTNSVGMRLALVPPGTFWLGSPDDEVGRFSDEEPRRLVEITRPFYLGVYPVTQEDYLTVMGRNPSEFAETGGEADKVAGIDTGHFPVETLSWTDAAAFCRRLSEMPAERRFRRFYRLPTEAEWEYACRGGVLSCPFPWGHTITAELANYHPSIWRPDKEASPRMPTPVGRYRPNGFGLYDVVGNVWEWCADWFSPDAYERAAVRDPTGPAGGDKRIVRGGAYHVQARRLRCADRSSFVPSHRRGDLGMRVLCEWHPDAWS